MIKAVHLTTVDIGGAYKAVCRIAESMKAYNVDSSVVVRNKVNDGNEIEYNDSFLKTITSKTRNLGNLLFSNDSIKNDIWGSDITKLESVRAADIVFIHWINSFLEYSKIDELLRTKTVVVVLHDMSHITGGCHYSLGCNGYEKECVDCPQISNIFTKKAQRRCNEFKKVMWEHENCFAVAISEWMKDLTSVSKIVNHNPGDCRIRRIWNPLNTDIFHPMNKTGIKEQYGFDDRPVILFGADRIGDEVKGVQYIFDALRQMSTEKYNVVCFGTSELPQKIRDEFSYIKCLGRIKDENKLAEIYSMANVFVTTATQEAFGYTCCEALACGTPVVAFETGGMKDQIAHKEWGYLAKVFDSSDVARGIQFCSENSAIMGTRAAEFVNKNFSYDVIGEQYYEYVEYILNEKRY